MKDQDFVTKLRSQYLENFNQNDSLHQAGHMDEVFKEVQYLNKRYEAGISIPHMAIMAYCHDLFTYHRDNHHELGYYHILTTNQWYMEDISQEDREKIAFAIREHRRSYEGEYTSIYSELLAAADRGRPGDKSNILEGSFRYGTERLGLSPKDAMISAFEYVKDRLSSGGRSKYPKFYIELYGEFLEKREREVDALTLSDAREMLNVTRCSPT